MSVINQVLITGIMSYMCTTMGIMYTWPASTYLLFSSPNTTLDRVMTNTELSLLGSISSFSALLITPFTGYLLDSLGRKKLFVLFSLVQVISWVILVCSNKVEVVLTAVCLSGLDGSLLLVVPLFICEICEDSIRGSMSSIAITCFGVGTLISYLLGGFLEYYTMNYVGLVLTLIGLVMLIYVRESPLFLMMKGRENRAAESIAFYRKKGINSQEVLDELNQIKNTLNPALHDSQHKSDTNTPEGEKLRGKEIVPKQKLSPWKFLKNSLSSRKALVVCLILSTASIFQGLVVVQVYAGPLFKEAVPSMSTLTCSVLYAVFAIVAGFIGAYLVEYVGRKNLMVYSSVAAGLCCLILGTQVQKNWGPNWLTAVFIYIYCIAYCLGAGVVPFVLSAEVFLPEIKSFASVLSLEWGWICHFIVLLLFNPIVTSWGLDVVFYIFSVSCFLSAIFCIIFQPETRGLTTEAIQATFLKKSLK